MARKINGWLAHLFAGLVALQIFAAGYGAFLTQDNEKFNEDNFGLHAVVGSLIGLVAIIMLILVLVDRRPDRVRRLTLMLFGVTLLQFVLAIIGSDVAVIGGLHALNALAVAAIAALLVKATREPSVDDHRPPPPVGSTI
jgi:heme A synthase